MNLSIANYITISRLISVIIYICVYYFFEINNYIICFYIFVFSSLTDYLDGYLARKLNQESLLGELLDPIADKMLVISSFIIISEIYNNLFVSLPIIFIILREIIISFLRLFFYSKKNYIIKVNKYGKIKTCIQLICNIILFIEPPLYNFINFFGITLLYITLFMSLLSLYHYIKFLIK